LRHSTSSTGKTAPAASRRWRAAAAAVDAMVAADVVVAADVAAVAAVEAAVAAVAVAAAGAAVVSEAAACRGASAVFADPAARLFLIAGMRSVLDLSPSPAIRRTEEGAFRCVSAVRVASARSRAQA